MKFFIKIFFLLLFTTVSFSQKLEKIKASKIVTVTQKPVSSFEYIEVEGDIDIFLIKATEPSVEIEADDNTHDAFNIQVIGNTLKVNLLKEISGAKKTSIRINYTEDLKLITSKTEANITALSDISLDNITFKCFDESRLFLNVNSKSFTLIANDKSRIELNLKGEDAVLELNKNVSLKALITTSKLKCDMYQKAAAVIEGDVDDFRLRMDNNTNFTGKNLTTNSTNLTCDGNAENSVFVKSKLILEASGKTETFFYGEGKIEIKKFNDEAAIYKRPSK